MYPISVLIRKHFYHDKVAREQYLRLTGNKSASKALRKVEGLIASGEIDQSVSCALFECGVSIDDIAKALAETKKKKIDEALANHKPLFKAVYAIVPMEKRDPNIGHITSLWIGHFTVIHLPFGIEKLPWKQQLLVLRELVVVHRERFYSQGNRNARRNYFGRLKRYEYSPVLNISFTLTPSGEIQ
jgi:hypothetical protein